jgi:hypothetical protein
MSILILKRTMLFLILFNIIYKCIKHVGKIINLIVININKYIFVLQINKINYLPPDTWGISS